MQISEIRIKLMDEPGERLKAFCSITFDDCFVVRDLKIIEGGSGPFVAMPSRKLTAHCGKCAMKNHLRANFCNQCGARMQPARMFKDADGRAKLYADIAHPINSSCREMIQREVVAEFFEEIERAKQPGYVSRYDDFDEGDFVEPSEGFQRRFDTPHQQAESSRPHHPPQGQPSRSFPTAPSSLPSHSPPSAGPTARQVSAPIGDGFGAGIFE